MSNTRKDDGGPAFPRPVSTDEHNTMCNIFDDQGGMTLREWFAGRALAGMLAHPDWPGKLHAASEEEQAACFAYSYADAMIAAGKDG